MDQIAHLVGQILSYEHPVCPIDLFWINGLRCLFSHFVCIVCNKSETLFHSFDGWPIVIADRHITTYV